MRALPHPSHGPVRIPSCITVDQGTAHIQRLVGGESPVKHDGART